MIGLIVIILSIIRKKYELGDIGFEILSVEIISLLALFITFNVML